LYSCTSKASTVVLVKQAYREERVAKKQLRRRTTLSSSKASTLVLVKQVYREERVAKKQLRRRTTLSSSRRCRQRRARRCAPSRYSIYSLYWYQSTNPDAKRAARRTVCASLRAAALSGSSRRSKKWYVCLMCFCTLVLVKQVLWY
jgi:hypothetical protein